MNPITGFLNLLAANRAGQDLTPVARAFLKTLQGFFIAALVAGITAAEPFMNSQIIDWSAVLHAFVASFSTVLGYTILKYCTAQGDPPQNPAPAQPVTSSAPVITPVSGGAYPVSPFEQAVPLPVAQRSAHG